MPVLSPAQLPSVTVPLQLLVPSSQQHYVNHTPTVFTRRRFRFWGEPVLLPLVRAFLETCAIDREEEFRYVFTLLGVELAANAMRHTRSGAPGGTYTLHVERSGRGLTLACLDDGDGGDYDHRERRYLPAPAVAEDGESGYGLTLVDALATAWGDNGRPNFRKVWFHLAHDLTNSTWPDV